MTQHQRSVEQMRRFVGEALRPYYWYIGGMIVMTVVWAIDQSLRPYLIKLLLDSVASSSRDLVMSRLVILAVIYVITGAVVLCSFRFYDWLTLRMMPALKERIALLLDQHLMGHDYRFYQEQLAGSLGNKINDVVDGLPELVELGMERFFGNLCAVGIAIVTMWGVHLQFAIAATVWVIMFVVGGILIGKCQRDLADKASEARSVVTGNMVDVCANMGLVRLFGGRWHEAHRLRNMLDTWVYAERKRAWSALGLYIFQGASFVLFEAVCLILLIDGFRKGYVTSGDFALIFSINLSLIYILWRLAQDITRFSRSLGSVTQGLRTILLPHKLVDRPGAYCLVAERGEIVFEHVSFSHDDGKPLFTNLSVRVPAHQRVGLVGYSGSGKSSFVNLMLRLFDVDAGAIYIDGHNIAAVSQESVRHAISFVPQDPTLFHRSVWQNIGYGNLQASQHEIIDAARKAHAHEFIAGLSHGYDTFVGERGTKLSGGQRQRIAIARAFLKKAPILIMDEATSSLDSVTEAFIQESLQELMNQRTTIIIAHRLSTLLAMDRILVFDKGVIVEDGPHAELLAKEGLYTKLWRAQVCGMLPEMCSSE